LGSNKHLHPLTSSFLPACLPFHKIQLTRVEYVHANDFVSRDLKPENFLIGIGPSLPNRVYMVDFGLAKRYRDSKTRKHVPLNDYASLAGTPRYASFNAHRDIGNRIPLLSDLLTPQLTSILFIIRRHIPPLPATASPCIRPLFPSRVETSEQSRRDDLQSLGFVLVYLLRGKLPWQGLGGRTKREREEIIEAKKFGTTIEDLCAGIPAEFAVYLNYTQSLEFAQDPDYAYLRQLFRDLFISKGFRYDHVYDWTLKKDVSPLFNSFDLVLVYLNSA